MLRKAVTKPKSKSQRSPAIKKQAPMTTQVEPKTSRRVDQCTFFISPSVAIRNSALLGFTPTKM